MRIAYIVTTLGIGGAEKQTIQIAERMHARGHVVVLLVLRGPCDQEWETRLPVMCLNLSKNILQVLCGLRFARSFLSVYGADIVHSHTFPANLFARFLRASGSTARVINTIHNVREGNWLRSILYRATNRWLTSSTAVSEAVRESYVSPLPDLAG
uniref:Glycosyltransferase subfamily 4-like N-terminal domain-containing protein n=1 Tax=mine drainage metagenome TaxID=410659 RepID=E6PYX7_9ZZZZ